MIIRLRSLYISIYHYLYALEVEGHWQNDKHKYTNQSGEIRGKQTQQGVWERRRNIMWVVRKMNKTKQRRNDIMRKAYDKDRGNIGASMIKWGMWRTNLDRYPRACLKE